MKCMDKDKLWVEQNSRLDYERYFLKRLVLRVDLRVSNADAVQRERNKSYQT